MGGTHTWMWAKKEDKLIEEDTVVLPIAVGLTVVLLVVTILYFLHKRPSVAGRTGTHTTLEGGKFVRRSSRCNNPFPSTLRSESHSCTLLYEFISSHMVRRSQRCRVASFRHVQSVLLDP